MFVYLLVEKCEQTVECQIQERGKGGEMERLGVRRGALCIRPENLSQNPSGSRGTGTGWALATRRIKQHLRGVASGTRPRPCREEDEEKRRM